MLELLFALTGIVFGLILAYIAPEEVYPGEKYLLWLKRVISLTIAGVMGYFFIFRPDLVTGYLSSYNIPSPLIYLLLPILLIASLLLSLKFKTNYLEIANYLLFAIMYLLLSSPALAALVFLYGLPAGTLLVKEYL
ncbi:MAG TPA: hypothetical protein VJG49_03630 [Candidatus Nanoarchaeia archaeon]|nr:hypothetical protein [Candidatus Nanoarchaeia archaeon]